MSDAKWTPGDIVAVRGQGWLSDSICKATDSPVSHVGMIVAADPPTIVEALAAVETHGIEVTLSQAVHVWQIRYKLLTPDEQTLLVKTANGFSGDDYGYADLALQLADAAFKTRWFCDHLAYGWLGRFPICSYVVARAYGEINITFGHQASSITPGDIYKFAAADKRFEVLSVK